MALVVCPRCDTLLKVIKVSETFFCPCGVELEHPHKSSDEGSALENDQQEENGGLETKTEGDSSESCPSDGLPGLRRSFSAGTSRPPAPTVSPPNPPLENTETYTQTSPNISRSNTETPQPTRDIPESVDSVTSEVDKISKCCYCEVKFTLFGKRKRTCRSCNRLVCANCSKGRWPAAMLPKKKNPKSEKSLRICTKCQIDTEHFRKALLDGNLEQTKHVFSLLQIKIDEDENDLDAGVQLYYPYLIYPEKQYPIHCAATSGNVELLSWMLKNRCNPKVFDAKKRTALAVCAELGHFDAVKLLIYGGYSDLQEVTDTGVLQKILRSAFINLQRFDIRDNLQKSLSTPSMNLIQEPVVKKTLEPKNELEAEEQLKYALHMSENEAKGLCEEATSTDVSAEADECVVCFDAVVDCVIIPCGHMSCCSDCGTQFKECPVCRQAVEKIVRTFKS